MSEIWTSVNTLLPAGKLGYFTGMGSRSNAACEFPICWSSVFSVVSALRLFFFLRCISLWRLAEQIVVMTERKPFGWIWPSGWDVR